MNHDNRRLREIQSEKRLYTSLYANAKEQDKQIYKGKLECLVKEEKEILERYDVIT